MGGFGHADSNAAIFCRRAVGNPIAVDCRARHPVTHRQGAADDVRLSRVRVWRGNAFQRTRCVKHHGRGHWVFGAGARYRTAVRVAAIDQGVGIPRVRTRFHHVLVHRVRVALSVIDGGAEFFAVRGDLVRVELHLGCINDIRRRVQVDLGADSASRLGSEVGGVDTQVSQDTVDDLAVGVHTIALQTRSAVGVGDKAVFVSLERTGTGVAQGAVVTQDEETTALNTHVQQVTGVVDCALTKVLGDAGQVYTTADGLAANTQLAGRVDIRELGARGFEATGRDVGDVVARNVELFVSRIEAAKADIKRHVSLLEAYESA